MCTIVGQLAGPVLIGVGAAFDFHSDRVKRAPVWMRDTGLMAPSVVFQSRAGFGGAIW